LSGDRSEAAATTASLLRPVGTQAVLVEAMQGRRRGAASLVATRG